MHKSDLTFMALAPNTDTDVAQYLLYNDLAEAELSEGKWFDGLASGEFTDMWGSEFEIEKADLQAFVKNTVANIQATATSEGDVVGLPIDMQDHERGRAAGWIVDARMSEDGALVQLLPKWTEAGRALIESGEMRFFSATFHLKKQVIVGGTLTNWPATRNEKEEILLKPIELSSPLFTAHPKSEIETAASKPAKWFFKLGGIIPNPPKGETPMSYKDLSAEDKAALAAEYVQSGEAQEHIEAEAKRIADEAIAQAKAEAEHEADVDAFVELVTSGDEEDVNGLPVPVDELKAHLMDMGAEAYEATKSLLTQIHTGRKIDFEELGTRRPGDKKVELPQVYIDKLDAGELELADLSNPALGLGDPAEYDLSKWETA